MNAAAGAGCLPAIDWSRRWLAPYRECGEPLARAIARGMPVAQALQRALAAAAPILLDAGPLCFVPAAELPPGIAYERYIAETAAVPTRDNAHDFFTGLVWLHEPALKRRLNELQAAEIARDGIGPRRGAVRDALTLIDENGALLAGPPALVAALRERDWPRLFGPLRPAWAEADLRLVGHALIEKLLVPRKPIVAHVWVVDEAADAAASLVPERLAARPFLPLPVLGVPGWCAENAAPAYYADATVFRPRQAAVSLGRNPSIDR